ncbi:MAG: putative protein of unknown function, zinc metallopeptidase [Bryobacterales bacterium]|nr:putative protein of unknown function, zinc metallopeptidase [Bryobacterales bacterium]
MRWTPGGGSDDIQDDRDSSGGGGGFGGFHLGIGGFILVGILSLVFHQNLFTLFSGGGTSAPASRQQQVAQDRGEGREVQFVTFVQKNVQDTWTQILPETARVPYRRAKLVLFRDVDRSGCGTAQAAIGPFYCPEDEKVYLDLSFFDELTQRFHAPGEFAQAYVIAHEFGHHVQKILGIEGKVRTLQQRDPSERNPLSVRLELQADCLAGVWAHSSRQRGIVENADIPAGLQAAASVGDDRLQRMARGRVSPETFTHGSSAQRVHWFRAGLDSGQVGACNTFRRSAPPDSEQQ